MRMKRNTTYLIAVAVALLVCLGNTACGHFKGQPAAQAESSNRAAKDFVTAGAQNDNPNNSRIQQLIATLSSAHDGERSAAAQDLATLARVSPEQRERVIKALLDDVEKRGTLDGRHGVLGSEYPYWISVTNLLAEFRATEAIDVLINCIHCGNGYTGSLGHQPAFGALVKLGTLAVPKLSEALLSEPNDYVRGQVALCLGTIGDERAERSLRQALRRETNKDVAEYIKAGIRTIDSRKYP